MGKSGIGGIFSILKISDYDQYLQLTIYALYVHDDDDYRTATYSWYKYFVIAS